MQIVVQYMMLEVVKVNQGMADKQVDLFSVSFVSVLPQANSSLRSCCFANKLLMLVQAGLIVDSCSRWHFGTTYVIKARPPPQHI